MRYLKSSICPIINGKLYSIVCLRMKGRGYGVRLLTPFILIGVCIEARGGGGCCGALSTIAYEFEFAVRVWKHVCFFLVVLLHRKLLFCLSCRHCFNLILFLSHSAPAETTKGRIYPNCLISFTSLIHHVSVFPFRTREP
jgi:hypothetical protein